ncbi:MAG TPA: hypothetical protein VMY99_01175 [Nevskiaceae bacterium]|nr:hypothetical protein [Nevskiaceae bacterium]
MISLHPERDHRPDSQLFPLLGAEATGKVGPAVERAAAEAQDVDHPEITQQLALQQQASQIEEQLRRSAERTAYDKDEDKEEEDSTPQIKPAPPVRPMPTPQAKQQEVSEPEPQAEAVEPSPAAVTEIPPLPPVAELPPLPEIFRYPEASEPQTTVASESPADAIPEPPKPFAFEAAGHVTPTASEVAPPKPASFEEIMQAANMGESFNRLTSEPRIEPSPQEAFTPLPPPVQEQSSSTDERFGNIVEQSLGAAHPGPVTWHEQAAGQTPVSAADLQPRPQQPLRPAEQFGHHSPIESRLPAEAVETSSRAVNPWAPAGDILRPTTLASIGALEAQHRINTLHYKAQEAGVSGAVVLLGMGLAMEHAATKRRDKKLEQQIVGQQQQARTVAQEQQQAVQPQQAEQQPVVVEHRGAVPLATEQQPPQNFEQQRVEQAPLPSIVPLQPAAEHMPPATTAERPQSADEIRQAQAREAVRLAHVQHEAASAALPEQQAGVGQRSEMSAQSPHEHVTHSEWHNIVVDDKGHEVEGAINYGRGFQQERQPENISDRTAGHTVNAPAAGATGFAPMGGAAGTSNQPGLFGAVNPSLPPAYDPHQPVLPASTTQPNGPPPRLEAPQKSAIGAIVSSPWLWLFLGLGMLVYFAF